MRVFVTGASGFVGSAVVPELIGAGHEVIGLARSDESAERLAAAGAEVQRGELADLDSLRAGAAASDGVIHLAFIHDFANFEASVRADRAAIDAFGSELEGSDRPLVIASGLLGLSSDGPATENDSPDPAGGMARHDNALATVALAERGVRSSVVRLAPSVHDRGDHGFVHTLIEVAREKGASGYVDDGANRWPGVHRLDAARLFRLAVEQAEPASVLHGVAEESVPAKEIAEIIGRHLDVPVVSVSSDDAETHFGWIGRFFGADIPATSELTREQLGWEPTHPGLVADLDAGHYFDAVPA